MTLPSSYTLVDDMFQHNRDEAFEELPNVFVSADSILIVHYNADGKDQNKML